MLIFIAIIIHIPCRVNDDRESHIAGSLWNATSQALSQRAAEEIKSSGGISDSL
jgi:hypothetical protein